MSLLLFVLFLFCLPEPYHHALGEVVELIGEDVGLINPGLSELDGICVLWDSKCTGNRTQAMRDFFEGVEEQLERNDCFLTPSSNCSQKVSSARALEFQKIKDWMRSPPCMSSRSEYNSVFRTRPSLNRDFCCDECYLYGDDVDVYYWPDPDADTSCTSLIGTDINPTYLGATTDRDATYWDCTTRSTTGWNFPIRTASMATIGSLTFKATLRDPWLSPLSCIGTSSTSKKSNQFDPILARGHSLIVPPSETRQNSMRVTTVVTNGFTLYVYRPLVLLPLGLD